MDQTPLAFDFMGSRTYKSKGAKTVFQKESQSGWDKRQCTLQVIVFADGKPYYPSSYCGGTKGVPSKCTTVGRNRSQEHTGAGSGRTGKLEAGTNESPE